MYSNEKGQTLVELIVVVAVGAIIISALTFAAIYTIRNSQFAKNQFQATKLAQEGMEKVKSIRDRDQVGVISNFSCNSQPVTTFSGLWSCNLSGPCADGICYFTFSGNNLSAGTTTSFEDLGSGLTRQVSLKDGFSYDKEKEVTVIVRWSDTSGTHDSKVTSILGNTKL
jgi:prepilin-type N-terminal cleavage/methylation domain-containing protein